MAGDGRFLRRTFIAAEERERMIVLNLAGNV